MISVVVSCPWGIVREATYFTRCVAEDRTPSLTLHDATEATRIAVALRTSLLERRIVDVQ